MKSSLVALALVLSAASIAMQMHAARSSRPLDKFFVPTKMSEAELRGYVADIAMMRNQFPSDDGIGVPFVHYVDIVHQQITVWVLVSEPKLPKEHNGLRVALILSATAATAAVESEFDLHPEKNPGEKNIVKVQFVSLQRTLEKETDKSKAVIAEFENGELAFH